MISCCTSVLRLTPTRASSAHLPLSWQRTCREFLLRKSQVRRFQSQLHFQSYINSVLRQGDISVIFLMRGQWSEPSRFLVTIVSCYSHNSWFDSTAAVIWTLYIFTLLLLLFFKELIIIITIISIPILPTSSMHAGLRT